MLPRLDGTWCRRVLRSAVPPLVVALLVWGPGVADAATGEPVVLAVKALPDVIRGLQGWVLKIMFAVGSLFLAYAGLLMMTAGGNPEQAERGKTAFRNALIGYAVAFLGPVFLQIVKNIIGA